MNISMVPMYETLCGITEEELVEQMQQDICCLAEVNHLSYDEQLTELKRMYDGYHFRRLEGRINYSYRIFLSVYLLNPNKNTKFAAQNKLFII